MWYWKWIDNQDFLSNPNSIYNDSLSVKRTKTFDPDAKKQTKLSSMTPILMHCVSLPNLTELFWMPKMKNVAKNEIVVHDPYSNALWGGCSLKSILHFHATTISGCERRDF